MRMRRYFFLLIGFFIVFPVFYFISSQAFNKFGPNIFGAGDLESVEASIGPRPATAGPMITVSDSISVLAPRSIRTSESKSIIVRVELSMLGHFDEFSPDSSPLDGPISTDPPEPPKFIKAYNEHYEVKISANGLNVLPSEYKARKSFDLDPESAFGALEWQWTISADEPGDRLVLISGLVEHTRIHSLRRPWDIPDEAAFLTNDTLTVPVRVLTPSGLTAQQDDLLSLASALVGLVAAVLGLSVWKILRQPE